VFFKFAFSPVLLLVRSLGLTGLAADLTAFLGSHYISSSGRCLGLFSEALLHCFLPSFPCGLSIAMWCLAASVSRIFQDLASWLRMLCLIFNAQRTLFLHSQFMLLSVC
jgi:hypothetical protein